MPGKAAATLRNSWGGGGRKSEGGGSERERERESARQIDTMLHQFV